MFFPPASRRCTPRTTRERKPFWYRIVASVAVLVSCSSFTVCSGSGPVSVILSLLHERLLAPFREGRWPDRRSERIAFARVVETFEYVCLAFRVARGGVVGPDCVNFSVFREFVPFRAADVFAGSGFPVGPFDAYFRAVAHHAVDGPA